MGSKVSVSELHQAQVLTPEMVNEVWNKCDKDYSGTLTKDELSKLYFKFRSKCTTMETLLEPKEVLQSKFESWFNYFDAGGKGFLLQNEFSEALEVVRKNFLLVCGPPSCGKTSFLKCLSTTYNWHPISLEKTINPFWQGKLNALELTITPYEDERADKGRVLVALAAGVVFIIDLTNIEASLAAFQKFKKWVPYSKDKKFLILLNKRDVLEAQISAEPQGRTASEVISGVKQQCQVPNGIPIMSSETDGPGAGSSTNMPKALYDHTKEVLPYEY
eukprot:TRINITY_DN11759_c0_g2_i3.p1 TRINITY_DN11759_c0_g2~~TRINITY_DN11759_c0_g2_i3.p1  ORF type:complete len:275 (+),score=64.34 TRINITY_DN11759_c0_g2_i3:25-849(+)